MVKISELVQSIPEHFEVIRQSLYEKSNDKSKRCGVCSLGGIALLNKTGRFEVLGGEVWDTETDQSANTRDILTEAGVDYKKQQGIFEYSTTNEYGKKIKIEESSLDTFIFMINDQAKDSIRSVVRALRKYGF